MVRRLLVDLRLSGTLAIVTLLVAAALTAQAHSRHRHHHRPSQRADPMIWTDEFRGPAGAAPNAANWSFDTGGNGWGNEELEYYTARRANAALDGHGDLVITARAEPYSGRDHVTRSYTSARLKTAGRFATRYGRIEARIRVPEGRGLWPAFWALGSDIESVGWPASGEIDIMESLGDKPFTLYGSIHGPQRGQPRGYALTAPLVSSVSLAGGFHVYGVDWSPNAIVFTFDGTPYATRTPASLSAEQSWVFNKPFFLLLNLAVGGDWPGAPDSSTRFPAQMEVNWVRVYS
jgi:beta-glucanase (GH16 family)